MLINKKNFKKCQNKYYENDNQSKKHDRNEVVLVQYQPWPKTIEAQKVTKAQICCLQKSLRTQKGLELMHKKGAKMGRRILNDALRTIVNAEKRGLASAELNPISNVMASFLQIMKYRGILVSILVFCYN